MGLKSHLWRGWNWNEMLKFLFLPWGLAQVIPFGACFFFKPVEVLKSVLRVLCASETSSISVTWKLLRNANSWTTESETLMWAPAICVLPSPLGNSGAQCVCVLVTQSCLTLCNPMDCNGPGSSVHETLQARFTEENSHSHLQGIFPTQGSNLDLPHCRQILYQLSHQRRKDYYYYKLLLSPKCEVQETP